MDNDPDHCVSRQDIFDQVKAGKILIVDVRNPHEVQGGKIEAERWANIPLPEFEDAMKMSDDDFKRKYNQIKPLPDGSDLVVHCGSGMRSSRALVIAYKLKLNKSKHLPGGYKSW